MSSGPGLLFVLNSLGVGGSEIKIIRVANVLARSGFDVELAYLTPIETSIGLIDSAVSLTCLDRRGKYSISALRRLRRLVKRKRQAVVAVNLYPLLYTIPAVMGQKLHGVTAIGLVNTDELIGKERFFGPFLTRFLKRCDKVVFGCKAQQMHWVKKYKIPLARSMVIYNGVDHEFFSPGKGEREGLALRSKLGIPDGCVVIGSIGRLAPEKDFDSLIIALSNLAATGRVAHVILAGQGPEQAKLKKLASAKDIDEQVHFIGVQSDVRPALSAMDIFVLPSKAIETFSNAALEAMSMSRAVVLSEIGGAAEMVKDGQSGILFGVGEIDALTGVLTSLFDSSDMRKRLGIAGRESVIARFSRENMVENYRKLTHSA